MKKILMMKKWLARKREDQVNPKNLNLQNLLKNLRHQRNQKRKGKFVLIHFIFATQ